MNVPKPGIVEFEAFSREVEWLASIVFLAKQFAQLGDESPRAVREIVDRLKADLRDLDPRVFEDALNQSRAGEPAVVGSHSAPNGHALAIQEARSFFTWLWIRTDLASYERACDGSCEWDTVKIEEEWPRVLEAIQMHSDWDTGLVTSCIRLERSALRKAVRASVAQSDKSDTESDNPKKPKKKSRSPSRAVADCVRLYKQQKKDDPKVTKPQVVREYLATHPDCQVKETTIVRGMSDHM